MDLLQTKGIEKQFLGVKALKGVDFTVKAGEIHALMGENGAGKSTLIKIITGVYPASAGSVYFNGKECKFRSPLDAEHAGISTVYQEVNLLPDLSVAENICIGREPRMAIGLIDKKKRKEQARKALARLDIDINVGENLSSYSIAIQQLVAIARALDVDCKLLILDEPTSSLDENEVKELFKVMKKLREEGMAIIFITHFLDQVYEVCDRITILRDGQLVGSYDAADLPRIEMVAKMIGKTPEEINQMQAGIVKNTKFGDVVYDAKNLGQSGTISPVDLRVRAGEQLGLAGLLGSGRSEIAQIIFGVDPHDSGTMTMCNTVNFNSPQKAVKAKVALIAEDRKVTGIIPDLTIRENIILALQASKGIWKTMTLKQQEEMADKYIKLLRIKTPSSEQLVKHLSGGNQQKVLIARWLATNPKLLILDEPTRGIDVGAKAEIEALTQQLCSEGMAVIFISSELEEVVRDCDRVVVLRDRKKVGEVAGEDISLKNVMKLIAG